MSEELKNKRKEIFDDNLSKQHYLLCSCAVCQTLSHYKTKLLRVHAMLEFDTHRDPAIVSVLKEIEKEFCTEKSKKESPLQELEYDDLVRILGAYTGYWYSEVEDVARVALENLVKLYSKQVVDSEEVRQALFKAGFEDGTELAKSILGEIKK